MGLRSSAPKQLEKAFAAAFATYFAGDVLFTKDDGNPIFTAAQATTAKSYPLVFFKCAAQGMCVPGSHVYTGRLHIAVMTALAEVSDDYETVDDLHDARHAKISSLLDLPAVLMGLINAPATLPDNRTVKNITVYGYSPSDEATEETDPHRLVTITELTVGFQATDLPITP